MEERILKDLDEVCREMIDCIKTTHQWIHEKGIRKQEVAEKMSGMVVDMGALLLELQKNSKALGSETERLRAIAELTQSCKNLEGMIKEIRNDLGTEENGEQSPETRDH